MLDNILPPKYVQALQNVNESLISEIRLREGRPTQVWQTRRFYLAGYGLTSSLSDAIIASTKELNDIVFNACQHSVYAHNDELSMGYLTLPNGTRLGIAGKVVVDKGNIKTIKDFSAINIRFAHEIKNFSLNSLPYLLNNDNKISNVLVLGPPNSGKTTFIRDLCYQMSAREIADNVLVVDERNEISASVGGHATLNIGQNSDVYASCTKQFGIINGIRTMSPNVIVLDELATLADIKALDYVVSSGVNIIATTHAADYQSLLKKPLFCDILKTKLFERFVILKRQNGLCKVDMITNSDGLCLYCGV